MAKLKWRMGGAGAVVAAGSIALVFVLSSSSSSNAVPLMPTVTTPAAAYTVPSNGIQVTPISAAQLATESTQAQAAVRTFCATDVQPGTGCITSVPDAIQQVTITVPKDPSDTVTDRLTYLAQWHLTGTACTLGVGYVTDASQWAAAKCTVNVAIEADTGLQYLSWIDGGSTN